MICLEQDAGLTSFGIRAQGDEIPARLVGGGAGFGQVSFRDLFVGPLDLINTINDAKPLPRCFVLNTY